MPESTTLILTTNPGLEDLVIAEFMQRSESAGLTSVQCTAKPRDVAGRVLIECAEPLSSVWPVAKSMRSIHHVHRPVADFELAEEEPLAHIHAQVAGLDIAEMTGAQSFRVSSRRIGTHDFTSIDLQRAGGAGVVERYQCAVNLTDFDTNVRVDVTHNLCSVMVQLTQDPLDYRYEYAYRPRVALKTNVAFCLLLLAGLNPDGIGLPSQLRGQVVGNEGASTSTEMVPLLEQPACGQSTLRDGANAAIKVLDPFCGSGTILIESAACLPSATILGNERFERPVKWTTDNLAELGLSERVQLNMGDARDIAKVFPAGGIDYIVTNPPFGAQLGQETNFYSLYLAFLEAAADVLHADGRIVMLVWKRTTFNKVVKRVGLKICHARIVDLGGLFPGIFVLRK